jgi:hypothetical protein
VRLPQDIANLLAVAVRDVIWFKDNVCAFLEGCGVPRSIMLQVNRQKSETPTIKLIHFVLGELAGKGQDGEKSMREMLTRMYYWKDIHSIPEDRKDKAMSALKAFQEAYKKFEEQRKYQEAQEAKMHAERIERSKTAELDHARLQGFRDEFDQVHGLSNPQERGNRFQDLMNRVFKYYCEESKGDFRREGEQIDGLFYFEKHWWYVEIRWKKEKASAGDISVLRDRARDAFGGDTKALFVSFNGFSDDCVTSMTGRGDERVILMDGYDLRCVLDCQIAFDVLLAEKQAEMVQKLRPFVGAAEILRRRNRPI